MIDYPVMYTMHDVRLRERQLPYRRQPYVVRLHALGDGRIMAAHKLKSTA